MAEQTASEHSSDLSTGLRKRVASFLRDHDPATTAAVRFLRARFDAGLAWLHFPEGFGGLGLPRGFQSDVDRLFAEAGAPDNRSKVNVIGLGIAAPTILEFGSEAQKRRFLRPLWTGEEIWCQLFSEPGAGSDLAGVTTRAVRDGDGWVVTGQKVWTSSAHNARFAILLARTDATKPKHAGLTYFLCDMSDPGVEVRPLRQLTGEAEFNEVSLSDVRIPDDQRLGPEGDGWKIAKATLNNERIFLGEDVARREEGMVGIVAKVWRENPELRTADLYGRLSRLWVDAEVARHARQRLRQKLMSGQPGPEGAAMKLIFADLNQKLSGLEVEMWGEQGLRYSDWTLVRPDHVDMLGRDAGYRYLRAKGNSIEGGTSEILRNIIAERVLGLPPEPRLDELCPRRDS
jgi:alkylation response protein AidB-like acyl-CoA dehydrogenase